MHFEVKKEKERLSQIVDTAYFVRLHHSSMAQVVDITAYLYRLYLELNEYGLDEAYNGEKEKITNWIYMVENKFISYSKVYPKKDRPFLNFINESKAQGAIW